MSDIELDFIEYAINNEGFSLPLSVAQGGESLFARQYQFTLQTLPLFMTRQKNQAFGQVAVDLFNVYKDLVLKLAVEDPDVIHRYFSNPQGKCAVGLLKGHTGLDYCLFRGDFALTDDGEFKLLEFNVSGNIGGWGIFLYDKMYRNYPAIKQFIDSRDGVEFASDNPLNDMVKHIVATSYAFTKGAVPNIAVWLEDPGYMERTRDMLDRIIVMLDGMGIKVKFTVLTEASQVQLIDDKIHGPEGAVDSLMLFDRIEVLPDFIHDKSERGEFPVFNNRASNVLRQKSGLALLSEYADWPQCSEAEKQIIEAHLPWTRIVKQGSVSYNGQQTDLAQLLLNNKDSFVLKPIEGCQGNDVTVGDRTTDEEWARLVDAALSSEGFIVQQFCASQQLMALTQSGEFVPHDAVWAPFVFGGQFAGNYVRFSPSDNDTGVINAHRGASDVFIFLHD